MPKFPVNLSNYIELYKSDPVANSPKTVVKVFDIQYDLDIDQIGAEVTSYAEPFDYTEKSFEKLLDKMPIKRNICLSDFIWAADCIHKSLDEMSEQDVDQVISYWLYMRTNSNVKFTDYKFDVIINP